MKEVILYGSLRKKYGKSFNFQVKSTSEVIRALWANLPGFRAELLKNEFYKVYSGNRQLLEKDLSIQNSDSVVRIIPVIAGSGKVLRVIAGAALLAFAFWAPWATIGLFTLGVAGTASATTITLGSIAFSVGTNLILGALLELLIGTPDESESKSNQYFRGANNYRALGRSVPIIYGEIIAGSRTISSNIDTVDTPGNFKSKQYASIVDVISEGEIEGLVQGTNSIYLGDSPVRYSDGTLNIEGVGYSFNPGTQHQNPVFSHGVIAAKFRDIYLDSIAYSELLESPIIMTTSQSVGLVVGYTEKLKNSQFPRTVRLVYEPNIIYIRAIPEDQANSLVGKYFKFLDYDSRADFSSVRAVHPIKSTILSNSSFYPDLIRTVAWRVTLSAPISTILRPSHVVDPARRTYTDIATFFSIDSSEITSPTQGSGINMLNQGKNLPDEAISMGYTQGVIAPGESINTRTNSIFTSDGEIPISDIQNTQFISNLGVFRQIGVGIQLDRITPIIRTVNDKQVDAVKIIVAIPHLSWAGKKGLQGTEVHFNVDVRRPGTSWENAITESIHGKITAEYRKSYLINLLGDGPWDIRVVKKPIREELEENTEYTGNVIWAGYTEIKNAKLNYPNTAMVGLSFDSSFFSQIPKRSYHVKGLKIKIPSNYNPTTRAYDGIWDGTFLTKYSNNPAWVLYDLITENRYGLGEYVSEENVDKWGLYDIAKYCDELVSNGLGGMEPRFTLNTQLLDARQALVMLRHISSVFRAAMFWGASTITTFQDRPTDATYMFTNANVVDGVFNYASSAFRNRKNDVTVTWNNPEDLYKESFESVFDDALIRKNGTQKARVVGVGCTSQGQAQRLGKWYLYSANMDQEIITFGAGLETSAVLPGDVIKVQDKNKLGARYGGRIKNINIPSSSFAAHDPREITLDAPITLNKSAQYKLSIMYADKIIERLILNNVNYTGDSIKLNSVVIDAADNGAVEVIGEKDSIWIVTSSEDVVTQLFRVLGVTEAKDRGASITAIQYNPDKFDFIEKNIAVEYKPTLLDVIPSAPKNVKITEGLYTTTENTIKNKVTVGWDNVPNASTYSFQWRSIGDLTNDIETADWSSAHILDNNSYDIYDAPYGIYQFRIQSRYSFNNAVSSLTEVQFKTFGKLSSPPSVENLRYTLGDSGILFDWDTVDVLDIDVYELFIDVYYIGINDARFHDSHTFRIKSNSYIFQLIFNEVITAVGLSASIRAVDTSGINSDLPTYIELELPTVDYIDNFAVEERESGVTLSWDSDINAKEYEIRVGDSFKNSRFFWRGVTTDIDKDFFAPAGTISTFWVLGIGLWGNRSNLVKSTKLLSKSLIKNRYVKSTIDFSNNSFGDTMSNITTGNYRHIINANTMNNNVIANNFSENSYFYGYHKYANTKSRLLTLNYSHKSLLLDGLTWENSGKSWNADIHKRPFKFLNVDAPGDPSPVPIHNLVNTAITIREREVVIQYERFLLGNAVNGASFTKIKLTLFSDNKIYIDTSDSQQGDLNFINTYEVSGLITQSVISHTDSNIRKTINIPLEEVNLDSLHPVPITNQETDLAVREFLQYLWKNRGHIDRSLAVLNSSIIYNSAINDYVTSSTKAYNLLTPYISSKQSGMDSDVIDSISGNSNRVQSYKGVDPVTQKLVGNISFSGNLNDFGVSKYAGFAQGEFLFNRALTYPMDIPQEFTLYFTFKNLTENENSDSVLTVIVDAQSINSSDLHIGKLLRYETSNTNYLLLWYEASTGEFHLQDNQGRRLTVYPQRYNFNDTFFIAFSQSRVKRRLVLKNYTGEIVSGEMDIILPETSSPSTFYKRIYIL